MKEELKGLNDSEINILAKKYGKNELAIAKKESFFKKIIHTIFEPMFLLLLIASTIYFILGKPVDGIVMLVFIISIITIDLIQEWKTDKTLKKLKDLSSPQITVIRNSQKKIIDSRDLVPGDLILIHEGVKVPADGVILKCSGLCVDESSLTGESVPVYKTIKNNSDSYWKSNYCYAGTLVISGNGTVKVEKIGISTEFGKIGKNVSEAENKKSPLQMEIDHLVKICAIIAILLCLVVIIITFINLNNLPLKNRLVDSILSGITLAMALIPEEFPVILTVFLSMGAWRLAKKKSLVKKLSSVETLGEISVLCVDKTGTITKNEMEVKEIFTFNTSKEDLIEVMGLCCEEDTYDPMEIALLNYCKKNNITKEHLFGGTKIKDYPFTSEEKAMGKSWIHDEKVILTLKGSAENILKKCVINEKELKIITKKITEFSKQGLRVIAVAKKYYKSPEKLPVKITNKFIFCGLIGLIDPPKEKIEQDIKLLNAANIQVCMITGDNGITASAISQKIGMKNYDKIVTGDEIEQFDNQKLKQVIKKVSIFSRLIPEHKMRIIKGFKDNNKIVAMTGDGVNDASALKYADIGIAMGKRGSEVSREAADLILLDDNFSTIIDTIKDGRRIYDNIKKAISYIFTIHIPIALASLLPPLLGISAENFLFLPMQVVLMELIIDPTSSIILERQPAESNIMERNPRDKKEQLVDSFTLFKSFCQGIVIFVASFMPYYYLIKTGLSTPEVARTIGLMIIMFSNIFLVQVNSSESDYAFTSLKKLIKDKIIWIITIIMLIGYFIIIYSPLNTFLKLAPLAFNDFIFVILISFAAVYWYEIVKYLKKHFN